MYRWQSRSHQSGQPWVRFCKLITKFYLHCHIDKGSRNWVISIPLPFSKKALLEKILLFSKWKKTRRGSPVGSRPSPIKLHHYTKLAKSGKINVTFEPIMQY